MENLNLLTIVYFEFMQKPIDAMTFRDTPGGFEPPTTGLQVLKRIAGADLTRPGNTCSTFKLRRVK